MTVTILAAYHLKGQIKLRRSHFIENTTSQKHGNFFIVSNHIFEFGLSARELAVYCCLCMHADSGGRCFPSRRHIAGECGNMSLGSVDKAIKSLCSVGLISVKHQRRNNGGKSSNLYTLARLIDSAVGDEP